MGIPIHLQWQYRVRNECRRGTIAYLVLGDGGICELTGVKGGAGCEQGRCDINLSSETSDTIVRFG